MSSPWFKRAQDISRMDRDVASQAEAEAGTNNEKVMTALRVAQGIGAIGGIGIDNLSYLKVVDSSFDATTPGYGNTMFSGVKAAVATAVDGDVFLINGYHYEGDDIRIYNQCTFMFMPESVVEFGTTRQFIISTATKVITFWGPGTINGTNNIEGKANTVGIKIEGVTLNGSVDLSYTAPDGSVWLNNVKCNGGLLLHELVTLRNCSVGGIQVTGASALVNMHNSDFTSISGSIDPLNGTNTKAGKTYRESTNVVSLPAAGNLGDIALTPNGGTGSIPALMFDNGTAWVVAAE